MYPLWNLKITKDFFFHHLVTLMCTAPDCSFVCVCVCVCACGYVDVCVCVVVWLCGSGYVCGCSVVEYVGFVFCVCVRVCVCVCVCMVGLCNGSRPIG